MSPRYTPNTGIYLGYYGCSEADRPVFVEGPRAKRVLDLHRLAWDKECTACGKTHIFQPAWRQVTRAECDRKAEQVLGWEDAIRVKRAKGTINPDVHSTR